MLLELILKNKILSAKEDQALRGTYSILDKCSSKVKYDQPSNDKLLISLFKII